uniref:Beta-mannosidase n=1 Tax=Coccolithus braarudii TaxID=221442 RepID=A0A7S0Q3I3_9EUKA|mmetsp:Transcript_30685/g.65945  ORF Transcript_30685/g.65945 Transcript_30685/m.65945 type:complete len:449 (+) Transcript_30685:108-1454(+)
MVMCDSAPGSALLLTFNGLLAACGQPLQLTSLLRGPPLITWVEAPAAGNPYTFEMWVAPPQPRNGNGLFFRLTNISGAALSRGACHADGTVVTPWALASVASLGNDLLLSAQLLSRNGSVVQETAVQSRSCTGRLRVSYAAQACECGAQLTASSTAASASRVVLDRAPQSLSFHTLLLIDMDALSWQSPSLSPLLHAAFVNLNSSALEVGINLRDVEASTSTSLLSAHALLPYMGPAGLGPGSYSAPHRYSWKLFNQPGPLEIAPFPAYVSRANFALNTWLAKWNMSDAESADDLFRSGAALPNEEACDGKLVLELRGQRMNCTTIVSEDGALEAPSKVAFQYPYFEDSLWYSLVAYTRTRRSLVWLVSNVPGTLINTGCEMKRDDNVTVVAPWQAPQHGDQVHLLLYVQPLRWTSVARIAREQFKPSAWAAAAGIAFPSASNAFQVM